MPVYRFEGPDGRIHRVEADTPEDAQLGLEQTLAPKPRTSQVLGLMKGVMKPLDNAAMALESGLRHVGVPVDAIASAVGSPSAVQAADSHAAYVQQQAEQGVVPGQTGEFIGNMGATLPLSAVTKNPWVLGALSAAALTDKRDPGGVALDAAGGAIMGKTADKALRGVANFISPQVNRSAAILKKAGIRLTPGQNAGGKAMIREDKLMSRPFVGEAIAADRAKGLNDFNIAALDKALAPLGVKTPKSLAPGFDAVAFADDEVKAAYNKITPRLKLNVKPSSLTSKISVPKQYQAEFDRVISEYVGNGNLTGQAVKNADRELKRLASAYTRSQVTGEQELGRALGRAHDRFTAALVAQNPADAAALKATNKAFRGVATVEDAAGRADGGVFSTGQLKQAVRRGDNSARKGASARGGAYMQDFSDAARQVLPAKYPDSGTAGRSAGIIASLRGAVDLAGYGGRKGYQALLDAPRPAVADPVAQKMLEYSRMFPLVGPAATSR